MAFVYETERSKLFNQNKTTLDIGPGQYLPLTEFKFQNPEMVPFGVSTYRNFPEKPSPYPGPGSYYHDVDKEKTEKLLKNSLKNYIAKEEEIKISEKGIAEYEPQKGEQERAIKRCKDNYEILGFNSKVKRFSSKDRKKTPGPGTYSDKNYKEAKSLEKKCYDQKATIFKINCDRNNVFKVDRNEVSSLNFNKNVFPEGYKEKKENKENKKNKKVKNKNSKKEIKKRLEEEQKEIKNDVKYRVSSIPSKYYKGFVEEKSTGKLVRKRNPEYFKIFSGDKDDAVGPGSYEIIFPEDWKKTGTSWSKYKWEKDPKKIRPKSSYNVNSINCEVGNFRKNKKKNENNKAIKEMSNYYKLYTTKQLNYKDPTAHNIDTITEVIKKRKMPSFIPMNNVPGPGFYYDSEMMNGMRKASAKPIIEKKPYNIEDELLNELFSNKNNNKEEGIIYDFKKEQAENFKKKILEKIKHKDIPFLSKSERFNLEPYIRPKTAFPNKNKFNKSNKKKKHLIKGVKVQNNYMTESDNISNDLSYYSSTNNSSTNNINLFYSRPQSMQGLFYRKDIRFRERQIEENSKKYVPGPGSYINPFTGTGKTNSIQINGRYMDLRTCVKYIENNRFNNLRPKTASTEKQFNNYINYNKNPGVGSYEPENIYTVKHDILKKTKQGNRTFNSTLLSNRNAIYQFQKNAPNGPGTYFVNNENYNIPQNYNGFNITSLRFEKGGKNNTKDVLEEINDNKIELNAIISTFMSRDESGIIPKKRKKNDEIKLNYLKNKNSNSYLNKKIKKNNIGPGTYEYSSERFPWVKPSFNAKYI